MTGLATDCAGSTAIEVPGSEALLLPGVAGGEQVKRLASSWFLARGQGILPEILEYSGKAKGKIAHSHPKATPKPTDSQLIGN